jgi:hypothetical protein
MSIQSSGFGVPVLVRADNTAEALRQVPICSKGEHSYDESWLQRLLFDHPEALPIAEIDMSFSPLLPLCMEMDTPAGPVDTVYVTPSGRLALLEAKLWRNPEARRKVIGQILDYAKELPNWDYSRLNGAVLQARKKDPSTRDQSFSGIAELVGAQMKPGLELHQFQDAVTKSLAKGDYLLLIAGDGIREGLGAIAQFLDRNGALHFTFGLIECAIYDAPDGGHYVHPRVLAKTTNIPRTVYVSGSNQITESESDTEEGAADDIDPDLEERRAKYRKFWEELLARVRVEAEQPIPNPAKGWQQNYPMPKGSDCSISAYLIQKLFGGVCLSLVFKKTEKGDQIYEALAAQKDEINKALAVNVTWQTTNSKNERQKSINIDKKFPGDLLTDSREAVQGWLADYIERFISVFRPRIDKILREQG